MQILYILIIGFSINAFFSSKIDTHNLFKKPALLFIIVGALVDNYHLMMGMDIENPFLEIGITMQCIADYLTAHYRKKDQRKTDWLKNDYPR